MTVKVHRRDPLAPLEYRNAGRCDVRVADDRVFLSKTRLGELTIRSLSAFDEQTQVENWLIFHPCRGDADAWATNCVEHGVCPPSGRLA